MNQDEKILEIIGHGINIQTLAEDQMYDERDGSIRQRLVSRMEMIMQEAESIMAMAAED